jgi:hypothetical protein
MGAQRPPRRPYHLVKASYAFIVFPAASHTAMLFM